MTAFRQDRAVTTNPEMPSQPSDPPDSETTPAQADDSVAPQVRAATTGSSPSGDAVLSPPAVTVGMSPKRTGAERGETMYDRVGEDWFHQLTTYFYEGVADDELLRPLYPEQDLEPARQRLALFLIQYWGGPTTYSEKRGHPRLRARHMPFPIGTEERDAWLSHMNAAVDRMPVAPEDEQTLRRYLADAAHFLMNRPS
jgi:hemoglobin